MTKLDEEVERLARRLAVARLALAQGGPAELLLVVLAPVADSIAAVNDWVLLLEQETFAPVDQPIGPATTAVLADMVSPVPAGPILPRDAVIGDNGEIITADGVTGRTLVHGCGHSHAPGTECPDADA